MQVIVVSGRYATASMADQWHATDAGFARDLVAAGCDVRWLVPVARPTGRTVESVRVIEVRTRAPAFGAVEGRVLDPRTESALSRAIREESADIVHLRDYGGTSSINLPWVANRLGMPNLVTLDVAAVLCHRGDLVHREADARTACAEWTDPGRCAACALVPSADGLTVFGAWIGRACERAGWPLHPMPKKLSFVNRLELVAGGLQFADRILVAGAEDQERLRSLRVAAGAIELMPDAPPVGGARDWPAIYAETCLTAAAGT